MRTLAALFIVASISMFSLSSFAADLGDPAGKLTIAKWVKGSQVDLAAQNDKITVVEFWATWCGPCRMSIPHLTEMQKRYGDKVTFVGVSDEPAETVEPFVAQLGKEMDYTVAVDTDRQTSKAFMEAYGVNGIPHAFVVQNGKVMWHGHPMSGLDKTIDQLLAGKFDMNAAKLAHAKEAEANKQQMAVSKKMNEYYKLVTQPDKAKDAAALGEELFTQISGHPKLLNDFAWTILTSTKIQSRDLGLASRAAKAAFDGTQGKDAAIADTYARALFDNGKIKEAIELQKKAIAICEDGQMKAELEENLRTYQAAEAAAK